MDDYTKRELRRPWMVVYLDGRNEHGSHVLPMPGSMMFDGPDERALHEDAEQIISEAEAAGHTIGHCVVTMWRSVEYEPGFRVWEYEGYHADLTAIFCGTPHEQRQELARIDADFQNAAVSN